MLVKIKSLEEIKETLDDVGVYDNVYFSETYMSEYCGEWVYGIELEKIFYVGRWAFAKAWVAETYKLNDDLDLVGDIYIDLIKEYRNEI